jgi:hypothetical protein
VGWPTRSELAGVQLVNGHVVLAPFVAEKPASKRACG